MSSEELNARYPNNKGKKVGSFELFETQLTTLKQYAEAGLIPNIDYGPLKTQKCDLIAITRIPNLKVVLVSEDKKVGQITETNWLRLAKDLLKTKCKPLGVEIGILTDRTKTYWINGLASDVTLISREDGVPMPNKIDFSDKSFITDLKYILSYFDPMTSQVKAKAKTNPDYLGKEVWQTVWRLKADRPEDCLATFVELFVFKFLNDLKLLTADEVGKPVSLDHIMSIPKEQSYAYYHDVVRPYIKSLFPKGPDGYSIINGIILQKHNRDHNLIFHEIMRKFISFGSLKNTDSDFKRRLYESFLKESRTTSNFGQFFTPRVIVSAIHEMAEIEKLSHGKLICDPAAGVGGFVLEQMARDLASQWTLKGNQMKPNHKWFSFEIIPKTSILAKANALVHCGDFLADQPSRIKSFSKWLNDTFICYDKTALGSLELLETNKYDVILTNPPFVVSGSRDFAKIIGSNTKRKRYYNQKYSGVEGLFAQFIVKSLKINGEAWVLLPESFLLRTNDQTLRDWILRNCHIQFVGILPERVFYNTPKRVVIVNLKKRSREETESTIASVVRRERTLLYYVSEIGETRDAKRFPCASNLPEMVDCYRLFKAGADLSKIERAIVVDSIQLLSKKTLNLRQFWNRESALKIGILSPVENVEESKNRITNQIREIETFVAENRDEIRRMGLPKVPEIWRRVKLGDSDLFDLKIGRRVLKKDIYQNRVGVPLFSANIRKPFGFVSAANCGELPFGGCLWSLDSDFDCRGVSPGEEYSITDHCGQLKLLTNKIDPHFLARQIYNAGIDLGFNREFRPSLNVIQDLEIDLPLLKEGDFDLDYMVQVTKFHDTIDNLQEELLSIIR